MNKSAFYLLSLLPTIVIGNPTGEQIKEGSAGIVREGKCLTIQQNTDKAIIHWKDFSIQDLETTRFIQPSASSAVLNRVTGNEISAINGNLCANGSVFLLNPNGVIVGPNGSVRASSFFASTLELSDDEFINNKAFHLQGSDGQIINQGAIDTLGGDIILIAKEIKNEGALAANGSVILAAGTEVYLAESGGDPVLIKSMSGAIDQKGTIEAAQVELKAAGGNMYSLAINHEGVIRAAKTVRQNGRFILEAADGLVSVSGTLDASEKGEIRILGSDVLIKEKANLSAPSGTILAGGDFHGDNPLIQNARHTLVEKGAVISTDAKGSGDGGGVSIWGNESCEFYGSVTAQGGSIEGDGGFVEISSPGFFTFAGTVSTLAPHGKMGQLLLDPSNINITNTSPSNPVFTNPYNPIVDPNPCNLFVGDLNTALASANVTVNTSAGSAGSGTITLDAGVTITWSAATQLTLQATQNIVLSPTSAIISTYNGPQISWTAILLSANQGTATAGTFYGIDVNGATISSVNGGITLLGTGGNAGANNYGVYIRGGSQILATGLIVAAADITITGSGGSSAAAGFVTNHGIVIGGAGTLIQSTYGCICLTGTGTQFATSATANTDGILFMTSGGQIVSTHGSLITLTGRGGNAATGTSPQNYGVEITNITPINAPRIISSQGGSLYITGTGGASTGTSNYGVYMHGAAGLPAIISLPGDSYVDVVGTASNTNSDGIRMDLAQINSISGYMSLTGVSTGTGVGFYLNDAASMIGGGGATARIMINTDKITINSGTIQSTGALSIQPVTVSTTIGIGTASAGTLKLTDANLTMLNSGGFSSTTYGLQGYGTGAVDIRPPALFTFAKDLTIQGGALSLNSALTAAAGKNITLAGDSIAIAAAITGTGNLYLNNRLTTTTVGIGTGSAGAFNLTNAELAFLTAGFSSINIGNSLGSGAIDVRAYTFSDPIMIRGTSITINGALAAAFNKNITLSTDTLSVPSTVSGSGTAILTLQPLHVDDTIGVGTGAGILQISDAMLAKFSGFSKIAIGALNQLYTIEVKSGYAFTIPLTVQGQQITLSQALNSTQPIVFIIGASGNYGVLNLNYAITAPSFTLIGSPGDDTINIGNVEPTMVINGSSSGDILTKSGSVNTWNINSWTAGGGGVGTLTSTGGANITFSGIGTFVGGTGGDTFNFGAGVNPTTTVTIVSRGGTATLNKADGVNVGSIIYAASASYTSLPCGNVGNIVFSNMNILTGGSGSDTYTVQTLINPTMTISGGSGSSTLAKSDGTNTWTISSGTNGTVASSGIAATLTFTNMKNLVGASVADTFIFPDTVTFSGSIDGGGGTNTVDCTAWTSDPTLDINHFANISSFLITAPYNFLLTDSGGAGRAWSINNPSTVTVNSLTIQPTAKVTGSAAGSSNFTFTAAGHLPGVAGIGVDGGAGANNQITGPNAVTVSWNITGATSGTINPGSGATGFTNIQNLTGGTGANTFAFADGIAFGGTINGDGGSATFDYSAWTTDLTLDVNHFFNINHFILGQANNLLIDSGPAGRPWTINNPGNVVVNGMTFNPIQKITGSAAGSSNFTFTTSGRLAGVGGVGVDGGSAAGNQITGPAGSVSWNISAANAGSINPGAGSTTFTSIQILTGAGTDTLSGPVAGGAWTINAVDGGILSGITFSHMETLLGLGGNDNFTFTAAGQITGSPGINGGGGTNSIIGPALGAMAWSITGSNAGSINPGAGSTAFTSIQTLTGNSAADTLTGPAAGGTWTISALNGGSLMGTAFTGMENLVGGNGPNTFAINDGFGITGSLTGGSATNTLDYSAYTGAVAFNLALGTATNIGGGVSNITEIVGGQAGNTLTGQNNVPVIFRFAQMPAPGSTVIGGTNASNTLSLATAAASYTWNITANDQGNVGNIAFTNVPNLVGGLGDDTFIFIGDFLMASIDGGGGSNTIQGPLLGHIIWQMSGANYSGSINTGSQTTAFTRIQNYAGMSPGPSDVLMGPNSATSWTIDSVGGGNFSTPALAIFNATFSGMEELVGGNATDNFIFTAAGQITGVGVTLIGIDGGSGSSTISGPTAGVIAWNVSNSSTRSGSFNPGAGLTNFTSIHTLSGQSPNDTLTGPDSNSIWNITETNGGNIDSSIAFNGMENLTGGSGNDGFVLSNGQGLSGRLDGGGGYNILDYHLYTSYAFVDIAAGTATNILGGIINIQGSIASPWNSQTLAAVRDIQWVDMTQIDNVNFGANGRLEPSPWDQKWIESKKGSVSFENKKAKSNFFWH